MNLIGVVDRYPWGYGLDTLGGIQARVKAQGHAAAATAATRPPRVECVTDIEPPVLELQHRFLTELPELCTQWKAVPVPAPELLVLNESLVDELDLDVDRLKSFEATEVFAGNRVPEGAVPVALGYAGHQFGNYSPRLGDGRALLLGELQDPGGHLLDVHLKGSGRTPFARGGDGRATIGPMLREYIVAEALHSYGVPTTRSLAVVTTGDDVFRDRLEPGAVLTRVAASHIRVGTFEYAVRLGGDDLVRRLADHVIARHHPRAADAENPYRELLGSVVDVQAALVAKWMLLGFIHGVMNTDNTTISGESIDYGPCAFMDRYDPETVFSSIDHGGRYAYGKQAPVTAWNLARFAESLLGILAEDPDDSVEVATGLVNGFAGRFRFHWRAGMAQKLGFRSTPSDDDSLFEGLLDVMHVDGLDWTLTFRRLAAGLRGSVRAAPGTVIEARSEALIEWTSRWRSELLRQVPETEGGGSEAVADQMDLVNPLYIPRNHLVDAALEGATAGDLTPFRELTAVLSDPFAERPGLEKFSQPASSDFTAGFRTFCGT